MTSNSGLDSGTEHAPHPARAVVAGHGDFSTGIVSAVGQICGLGSVFLPFSNRGLCGDDQERAIAELLDRSGAQVIFTDLPAGSATIAARRLQRLRPGLVVVTGANVATLLDFALAAEDAQAAESAARAVERGRAALAVVKPPPAPAAPPAPEPVVAPGAGGA
jgi:PTS system N-acetylgalactosamine-specific IIA component